MVRFVGPVILAAILTTTIAVPAQAGDPAKGKMVAQRCLICHRVEKDGGNGLGPNLFGIVGRKAGAVPNFAYSPAMRNSGIVWTADKLAAYITHPAQVVPGNRMAFAGINDQQQVGDVVAYLATLK
jgi:cytochrome c